MNIVKQIKSNQCAAMRCKEPQHVLVDGVTFNRPGIQVPLCQKHEQELDGGGNGNGASPEVVQTSPIQQTSLSIAIAPPMEIQQELLIEQTSAEEALKEIESSFKVDTDGDLSFAAEVLSEVKGNYARLEERKRQATDPLNQALKTIRSWFKPAQDFYVKAEVVLKNKIAAFHQLRAQERQAALLQAQAAFVAQNQEAVQTALAALPPPPPKVDGLSTREDWSYEVIDFAVLPDEYKLVIANHDKLLEQAKVCKDKLNIPGVRSVCKTVVISRAS